MSAHETILVVAGEVSGDLHAAPVIAQIKRLAPDAAFLGAGGDLMSAEGVELLAHVRDLAVMGFSGIPRVLPKLAELKRQIIERVKSESIRLAILTDYPGFNLNLVASLKMLPDPPQILYYIAPQLWAWRPGRAELIKSHVDRLAVVFAFEVDFFSKWGIEPFFAGHPLLDELNPYLSQERVVTTPPLLALLPGSRPTVAKRHVEIMLKASRILADKVGDLKVVVGKSRALREWWDSNATNSGIEVTEDTRALLRRASLAAVCSGTATLEAALLGAPQVVVYKTSPINYLIARRFIRIPRVGMVNIVAGREIVPELLQSNMTPRKLAYQLERILRNTETQNEISRGYSEVRAALGEPGAAERVASLALSMLGLGPEPSPSPSISIG